MANALFARAAQLRNTFPDIVSAPETGLGSDIQASEVPDWLTDTVDAAWSSFFERKDLRGGWIDGSPVVLGPIVSIDEITDLPDDMKAVLAYGQRDGARADAAADREGTSSDDTGIETHRLIGPARQDEDRRKAISTAVGPDGCLAREDEYAYGPVFCPDEISASCTLLEHLGAHGDMVVPAGELSLGTQQVSPELCRKLARIGLVQVEESVDSPIVMTVRKASAPASCVG